MSEQAKAGIYVYQPFGVQDRANWESGRIYGIGGLPMETTCRGFTKEEAQAICNALAGGNQGAEQGTVTPSVGDTPPK